MDFDESRRLKEGAESAGEIHGNQRCRGCDSHVGDPAVEHPDGPEEYWHRGRPCHAHKPGGPGKTRGKV